MLVELGSFSSIKESSNLCKRFPLGAVTVADPANLLTIRHVAVLRTPLHANAVVVLRLPFSLLTACVDIGYRVL